MTHRLGSSTGSGPDVSTGISIGSSARGNTQPISAAHAQSILTSWREVEDKGLKKWCKFPVPLA